LSEAVRAWKFLRPGAVGPFSGFAWPAPAGAGPGEWVEAESAAGTCRDGVHACEAPHLPLWIWEELWEVELDGLLAPGATKLRARRGRLLRRVEAWSPPSARALARACAERAGEHAAAAPPEAARLAAAMAADGDTRASAAEESDDPYVAAHGSAVSAYIAAMTALRAAGPEAFRAERAWQAEWFVRELDLTV
jgi:hypothetical protein